MNIRIIGSMIFYDKYLDIKKDLESLGHVVILPLPDEYYNKHDDIKKAAMEQFDDDLEWCDALLMANYEKKNIKNYIGINSIMEIGMAFNRKKKVFVLFSIPDNCVEEFTSIGVVELKGNLNKIN